MKSSTIQKCVVEDFLLLFYCMINKKQLMYSENKCIRCKTCLKNCPKGNIKFINNRMIFDRRTCGDCEICGEVCPSRTIYFAGRTKSIDEIMGEVMKDKDYYDDSNGGITISGGEPFVQIKIGG